MDVPVLKLVTSALEMPTSQVPLAETVPFRASLVLHWAKPKHMALTAMTPAVRAAKSLDLLFINLYLQIVSYLVSKR